MSDEKIVAALQQIAEKEGGLNFAQAEGTSTYSVIC